MISEEAARTLAERFHHGQTEKGGVSYIHHLRRVADLVDPVHRPLAWLHDLFEDTAATDRDVADIGGSLGTILDLRCLSRRREESYREFIGRIRAEGSNPAVTVKFADVVDHLRPGCTYVLNADQIGRYEQAIRDLMDEITHRRLSLFPACGLAVLRTPLFAEQDPSTVGWPRVTIDFGEVDGSGRVTVPLSAVHAGPIVEGGPVVVEDLADLTAKAVVVSGDDSVVVVVDATSVRRTPLRW